MTTFDDHLGKEEFAVLNKGVVLGKVKWHKEWKQWVFMPETDGGRKQPRLTQDELQAIYQKMAALLPVL